MRPPTTPPYAEPLTASITPTRSMPRSRTKQVRVPDAESQRQQMMAENLGLVHFVARSVARSVGGEVELDELVSAGTLGLMSSVDAFDVSRGLAFSTFATPRIRGAMIDELRRQDHVPRSVRRKTRELRAAQDKLRTTSDARPTDRQTAEQLGIDVDTLWRWEAEVEGTVMVPLDNSPVDDDGGVSEAEVLGGISDDDIEQRVGLSQEVELMRDAILTLKEQERIVLSLYYYEDLKLHEIAMALGITESRVSQIRTKALANLRVKLAPMREITR